MSNDYSIDAELAALAAPLRRKYARIEEAIAELNAQRDQLRADRTKIVGALRVVDPSFSGERKVVKPTKGRKVVADNTEGEILSYITGHRIFGHADLGNGNGFCAADLLREDDFQWSQATASAALRQLHEKGVLRLDHTGTGGGKWFALVT